MNKQVKTSSRKIKNRLIWREIAKIAKMLKTPAYLVGGAVRDQLLGIPGEDSDFLVLGPALKFAEKARMHLDGSRVVHFPKFGSAFFMREGVKIEFAEPRVPGGNLAEPEWVTGDLQGRDFTINAVAAPLTENGELELFDPLNGIDDLKKRILRTPTEPEKILSDDPVRILRAFRFAAKFNFKIDPLLKEAIMSAAPELDRIAGERIGYELWKILELERPSKALKPMMAAGVIAKILPEVARLTEVEKRGSFNHKNIFLHSLKVLDNVVEAGGDTTTRFAALVHDVAKPLTKRFHPINGFTFHGHEDIGSRMVGKIGRRLRLPNDKIKLAQKLTLLHMRPINLAGTEVSDSAVRRLMTQAGEDLDRLLILCRADITSGNPQKVKRYLKNFDFMVRRMGEVDEKDEMRAFQSPVRGEEIMEICGIQPGPLVGKIKSAIEEAILDGKIPHDYDAAKEFFLNHKEEWMNEFN